MLTIKAFINGQEIERIDIQNVGHWLKDVHMYSVRNPDIPRKFFHNRKRGWKELAKQVLSHLISLEETEKGE